MTRTSVGDILFVIGLFVFGAAFLGLVWQSEHNLNIEQDRACLAQLTLAPSRAEPHGAAPEGADAMTGTPVRLT